MGIVLKRSLLKDSGLLKNQGEQHEAPLSSPDELASAWHHLQRGDIGQPSTSPHSLSQLLWYRGNPTYRVSGHKYGYGKRSAEPEPEADPYHRYYGYRARRGYGRKRYGYYYG